MFPKRPHHEIIACLILYLCYFLFQLFFIPYSSFSVDEFWFAHHIYEYTHKLPYRDFLPYKTVLGYYLFSIPYFFSHTLFTPFYIKYEIAIINIFLLMMTARSLMQFFSLKAIFYTSLMILSGQFFLIYSVDLRVDMLTAWAAFIAVLFLLSNRALLAGILMSISFLISQKALWFFVAANIALISNWIFLTRDRKTFRVFFIFNFNTCLMIAIYLFCWGSLANFNRVLNSVFYEGYLQSKITWYSQIYYICWRVILSHGPLLLVLWPLIWLKLLIQKNKTSLLPRDLFIAIFSTVMMFFIISYQQAFPYQMVYCVPVFFLVYTDFLTWFFSLANAPYTIHLGVNNKLIKGFLIFYSIILLLALILFELAIFNYCILLIPFFIYFFIAALKKNEKHSVILFSTAIFILLLLTGVFYPLLTTFLNMPNINNQYQYAMLKLSNHLLKNEKGGYFAGIQLLYDKDEAIPGLKNLIGPTLDYINQPSKKLLPIYLTSLELIPMTEEQIIKALKHNPVKFYVNNYRITLLPKNVLTFLSHQYTHFWGSIYIYAPTIFSYQSTFKVAFAGRYIIQSLTPVYIDHKKWEPLSQITLETKLHTTSASKDYQLTYVPNITFKLNSTDQEDEWLKMTKAIVL